MESIAQTEMMEHCLRQIRKHPYEKEGLEHYIFLKLLEECSNSEYEKIIEDYAYITKKE